VTRVENLGSDRLVYGVLEPPSAEAKVIARVATRIPIRIGEVRPFGVYEQDLKFFDKGTGQRTQPRPLPQ
jgi:multiple sugar transport system ATP-binding protein